MIIAQAVKKLPFMHTEGSLRVVQNSPSLDCIRSQKIESNLFLFYREPLYYHPSIYIKAFQMVHCLQICTIQNLHINFIPLVSATSFLLFHPHWLLIMYAEEWPPLINVSIVHFVNCPDIRSTGYSIRNMSMLTPKRRCYCLSKINKKKIRSETCLFKYLIRGYH
jgi:hypothetical protein